MDETMNPSMETSPEEFDVGGYDVNVSDLIGAEAEPGTVEPEAAETAAEDSTRSDGAQPEPRIQSQTDFNAALKTRLAEKEASVSRRFTGSPEYQLGKMILAERMQQDGVTAEEAAERIRQERIEQRAQQYQQNPQEFYKDYLQNQTRQTRATQLDEEALDIARQLRDAENAGIIPENFDLERDVTPEFISDVIGSGVLKAVQNYNKKSASTEAIIKELERRQRAPQPIRPTGGSVPPQRLDYANMTSEQFAKIDAKINAAIAQGKRVKF